MARYRVAQGSSILLPDGRTQIKAGQFLPRDYPAANLGDLLRDGHIEQASEETADRRAANPGTIVPPAVGGMSSRENNKQIEETGAPVEIGTSGVVRTTVSGGAKTQISPWTLNPETLKGKDVDTLNVMVKERDKTVEPFDTAEEAVAWLSQDYTPERPD